MQDTQPAIRFRAYGEQGDMKKPSVALRRLEETDIPKCFEIFNTFMQKFDLSPNFSEAEFAHWVLPRDKILYSFVREENGQVVDFASFYSLPSSVLDNQRHSGIEVAYLFYYGASEGSMLESLMTGILWEAKQAGFDVFNALDIMQNGSFLHALGFAPGDGTLHYYLYNWKTGLLRPDQVGVAML